jgi:fido (protein-threonine AMPylation protein)
MIGTTVGLRWLSQATTRYALAAIHEGWSTSEDDIPQPTSIVLGRNLRKPKQLSEAEKLLKDIKQYCAEQKTRRVGRAHLQRIHKRTTET